ncbi:MAG: NUDIX domain-containing protein [Candidatus Saccharibacteria bacterium]|nr:NUDIX domain-containing protein [Candidatus Saccharibacteria bacterium]
MLHPTEYRATKDWFYSISAGGVVYRKTSDGIEVLLLFRDRTEGKKYYLPKGTLHHNETLEDCARREVLEETGARTEIANYLMPIIEEVHLPEKEFIKTVHFFIMKYDAMIGVHDDEHDGVEWVRLSRAKRLLKHPNSYKRNHLVMAGFEHYLAKVGSDSLL